MKRLLSAALLSLSVTVSPVAISTVMTFDNPNFIQQVLGNLQEVKGWMEEKALMMQEMTQRGVMTQLMVAAENNGAANIVTRLGKTLEEIQNIEQIQKMMPPPSSCSTITASRTIDEIKCDKEDEVSENSSKFAKKTGGYVDTPATFKERKILAANTIINKCRALDTAAASEIPECIRTDYLLGGFSGETLSDEQAEATKAQIDIIVGPIPDGKTNSNLGDDYVVQKERIKDYRKHGLKMMAMSSLQQIRAERVSFGADGNSYMSVMTSFVEDRFGSESAQAFMKKITNSDPNANKDVSKVTTPEQVQRETFIINSFNTYLSLLKYKQQLRLEALTAALLTLEVDPIK